MCEVNTYGSEKRIDESLLQKTFDRVWIDLEADASEIEEPSTTPLEPRKVESMVEEILEIVRSLQRAYQEEKDSPKFRSEAIEAAIRRALTPAVPHIFLSET
jgi:hypothetical protein